MNPRQHRADEHRDEHRSPRGQRGHQPDEQFEDLFTVAELATLLRVPQATVRYWLHCGTGPTNLKIGRHVRFRRGDIDTWLRHQRRAGGSVDGPDVA